MESPRSEEVKQINSTMSWGYSSFHNHVLADEEEESHPKKLNVFHFICIGMFLALAFLTIAGMIYSFVS
jgi:hypothetical protein